VRFFSSGSIKVGAVVAEWLRRLTRNQIPSGSAGSNPADCEFFSKLNVLSSMSTFTLSVSLVSASLVQW
jgi:hypothetical protein